MPEQRVLVTGATGLLGRPLVQRLSTAGWSVTALSRRSDAAEFPIEVERLAADLADPCAARAALEPWRWDAIVNLAGPAFKGVPSWAEGAVLTAAHVRIAANLRAAIPAGWSGRLVHASGFIVYGVPDQLPVAESHPRRPLHAYGLAKVLAEDVLLAGGSGTLDRWILRLPGIFSEERREGALYRFVSRALAGEPLVIDTGSPLPWDVLHVEDAVEALVLTLKAEGRDAGPVNIGYGDRVELSRIARFIAERAGAGSEVHQRGPENPVFVMDITRARELLGWAPPSLQDRLRGLMETEAAGRVA